MPSLIHLLLPALTSALWLGESTTGIVWAKISHLTATHQIQTCNSLFYLFTGISMSPSIVVVDVTSLVTVCFAEA